MAGSTGPKKMLHENTGPSHGPKYWEGGLLIKIKIIGVAAGGQLYLKVEILGWQPPPLPPQLRRPWMWYLNFWFIDTILHMFFRNQIFRKIMAENYWADQVQKPFLNIFFLFSKNFEKIHTFFSYQFNLWIFSKFFFVIFQKNFMSRNDFGTFPMSFSQNNFFKKTKQTSMQNGIYKSKNERPRLI